MRIGAAEPRDPVSDVAGLALGVRLPAPVIGPAGRGQAESLEDRPFRLRRLGAGRVGQDEQVEGARGVELSKALVDTRQSREGRPRILVVEGHQQGRADLGPAGPFRKVKGVAVAPDQLEDEAGEGAAEPAGERDDQGREQAEGDDLKGGEALFGIDPRRRQEGQEGERQGGREHGDPAEQEPLRPGDRRRGSVLGQSVTGHVQRGFLGKPGPHGGFAGPGVVRRRAELPVAKTVHRPVPLPGSADSGRGSQTRYVAAPHMQ